MAQFEPSGAENIPEAIRQSAARWLTEREAGSLTPADEAEFARWMTADARHAAAYRRLERVWAQMGKAAEALPAATPARPAHYRRYVAAGLAACLALFALAAAYDLPVRLQADHFTSAGQIETLRLSDGSVLHLNSRSAVSIDYSPQARRIRLIRGEAAFEVAADKTRPFTVAAGKGQTTALGTRFVVLRDDGREKVMVSEHSVRVQSGTDNVIVSEGHATEYGPDGVLTPFGLDVSEASAWMRGRVVFVDRPLSEVVAELNRYRKMPILIFGPELEQKRFSGTFAIGDPSSAIGTIEKALALKAYRLPGGFVVLRP